MKIIHDLMSAVRQNPFTKYVVILTFIVLVVGFVDENSLWNRRERLAEIAKLKADIARLKAKYEEDTSKLNSLDDYDSLVRLAREKYLMHRPDEDVYLIRYVGPDED